MLPVVRTPPLGPALGLTGALLAGCSAGPPGGDAAAPVPSASSPVAVAPSPGEVRLSLSTHCGVRDAEVGGVYWAADPPLGNGNEPPGWGDPETQGRWRQTGETTAVFLADSGVSAAFVRAERPDPYPACE
jgi:hypothetical protein